MVTTLTLRIEPPRDRTLRIPLPSDVPEGPLDVVVMISSSRPALPETGLAGRWQVYFPPDFDIDRALHEIRHEWEAEWTETEI
ncbi:MAG: hypothetical protein N2556_06470 [Anaerolineae bacterium]|nr:hypothetical protein [Anaerolineae bacterium]